MIFFIFFLLICIEIGYFKIADKYNIIDKPNQRSSHSQITLRGGGIIFPISFLLWFFVSGFQYPYLAAAVVLLSTISFVDDVMTLSTKPRLTIHLLSVGLTLYELGFELLPWWAWILGFVLVIGWLNAFNFMDGINGITVLYALSVILPLGFLNYQTPTVDQDLYVYICLGLLVFGFFNVRRKAKTFAGDIGSISLGLLLVFCLISLILATGDWFYVVFVAVYGIDSVITIMERILRKENIFEAHRSHLYQYLANEKGIPHVRVSVLYALIQFSVSSVLIYSIPFEMGNQVAVIILLSLGLLYLYVKKSVKSSFSIE